MDGFEEFYVEVEPKLRRALVAALGPTRGREGTAEAMAYAWEHWDRVEQMEFPVAYLFRVGQTRSRERNQPVVFPATVDVDVPWIEPGLPAALAALSEHQRVAVVLAHGYGYTHREVGELLGISPSSVQNHVERAMTKLQAALEVHSDD
jgi:DNA-directed RNA polymerase specialized sigma24 family protein